MNPDQIVVTNPTLTVDDYPFAFPNHLAIQCGFGVTVNWSAGAAQLGHAITGFAVVNPDSPAYGSTYGVEGGVLNLKDNTDCGGLLGVVSNAMGNAASGCGVWGLARGFGGKLLQNMIDCVRGTTELEWGRVRTYFLGGAQTPSVAAHIGVYLQGSTDAGLQIGGPLMEHVGGAGYPTPTWPIIFYNNSTGTPRFSVDASGRCTASGFQTISDARLKSDIRDAKVSALDLVQRMRVREYEMYGTTHIGLIEQELRKILPDACNPGDADHPASIDYGKVVPFLILAIQEMTKR